MLVLGIVKSFDREPMKSEERGAHSMGGEISAPNKQKITLQFAFIATAQELLLFVRSIGVTKRKSTDLLSASCHSGVSIPVFYKCTVIISNNCNNNGNCYNKF
jgi:hypothetical protein